MKLAYYFAKRYFFSRKSIHAINIISGISMIGVLVSSASLIAILSFYNGLENLLLSMFSSVASEIRIEPARGKVFDPEAHEQLMQWADAPQIASFEPVLQEKVLLQYGDRQFIAQLKGVEESFTKSWETDSLLYHGDFRIHEHGMDYAVIGQGVDRALRVSLMDEHQPITLFSPRKGAVGAINPAEEFNVQYIAASGVMGGHEEINDLVIVPLSFARDVLGEYEGISAIEINVKDSRQWKQIYSKLKTELGPELNVLSREEQNPTLYKIIRSEKWAIFAILTFTGFIAVLNIIGSLTMLVIDKRKDIAVLKGMGADHRLVSQIFFIEGMMIALIGCLSGLLLGFLVSYSQLRYGWLKFSQPENIVVDTYPVDIRASDFLLVFLTVFVVSLLVSWLASRLSIRQNERLS
ncbi:MAG TPA: FtsX-like permease family protein [Sphingobacteriaceae bacterium]|nr:FtsX-like permease family protein [Sphingobacteriaceae bacterium]